MAQTPARMCIVLAAAGLLLPARIASAQTTHAGMIQIGAATNLGADRQTVATYDAGGVRQPGNLNLSSLNVGCEIAYYLTSRVGIGALVSHERIEADAADGTTLLDMSQAYYGLLALVRAPLGDRAEFVFAGSAGGVRAHREAQGTDVQPAIANPVGAYWLAGGGLSVPIVDRASLDVSLRYQSSRFTAPAGVNASKATSAGLLVGLGFSVYLH